MPDPMPGTAGSRRRSLPVRAPASALLAAAVTTIGLAAAGPARAAEPGKGPDGKALFTAKCQLCHGADGVAKLAAKGAGNFNDAAWQAAHTDEQLVETIREGRKGTAMVAWEGRLKEEEMRAIVAHIRTLAPKP